MPDPDDKPLRTQTAAGIAALWDQFRPLVQSRVDLIDDHLSGRGDGDAVEVARAAHNLAGALGSYGRPEGSVLARRIEQALLAGDADSLAQAEDDVVKLRTIVET